jgi:hypothetical protein
VQLAPLMPPHPGCLGFYRSNRDLDQISQEDPLRGYKVYRTTSERGSAAPWHYATQGTYDEYGALQPPGPVSRNCDLLHEGVEGELTLSLRSLSRREIALLLATCSVDWRLGGGKPLGLGHCRVTHLELLDEFGETRLELDLSCSTTLDRASPAEIPSAYASEIDAELAARLRHYQATQRPVPKLRYPRAAKPNRNKTNRGGQVWFQRHASPRKGEDRSQQPLPGLQVLRVTEELAARVGNSQIQAQRLPDFDPAKPLADVLYGYDCLTDDDDGARGGVPSARGIAPFDPTRHSRPTDRSGGHQGQSRETRRGQRGDR